MNIKIARATTLRSTSFSPWDKNFPFQIWRCCQSFILISEKAFFFERPIMGGRSIYFSYCLVSIQPYKIEILFLPESPTFLLKIILVLSIFMQCQEACAYSSRIFRRLFEVSILALQKLRLSSPKSKWFIVGAPLQTCIPMRLLSSIARFNRLTYPSVHRRNR